MIYNNWAATRSSLQYKGSFKIIIMIQINNNLGYTKLLSFKKGGLTSKIPDAKKKELFPYFAYLYSKQLNPEKYGSVASMEE
jgi:hypothetical protein